MTKDVYIKKGRLSISRTARHKNTSSEAAGMFPGAGELYILAMTVLDPLRKAKSFIQRWIDLVNQYTKVKTAISINTIASPRTATAIIDNMVFLYGTPKYLLINIRPKFVTKFFAAMTARFGIKLVRTAANHL